LSSGKHRSFLQPTQESGTASCVRAAASSVSHAGMLPALRCPGQTFPQNGTDSSDVSLAFHLSHSNGLSNPKMHNRSPLRSRLDRGLQRLSQEREACCDPVIQLAM